MSSTIEGHRVDPDNGLFDGTQYDLPIPKKDNHKADGIQLSIGGSIAVDLYDEAALAYIHSLKLGQEITVTITAEVADSGSFKHRRKGEDQESHVVYVVQLRAHSIDIPKKLPEA